MVGFLLCLHSCGEGGEDGFAGSCHKFVRSFLCHFENGSCNDHIGRFYLREDDGAIVEKLYNAFAWVAWIKLADDDSLKTFLK